MVTVNRGHYEKDSRSLGGFERPYGMRPSHTKYFTKFAGVLISQLERPAQPELHDSRQLSWWSKQLPKSAEGKRDRDIGKYVRRLTWVCSISECGKHIRVLISEYNDESTVSM
jgi:hypothetical protein